MRAVAGHTPIGGGQLATIPGQSRRRAARMVLLGYAILALCAMGLLSSITSGRPAGAALIVLCSYMTWTALQVNIQAARNRDQRVVDEPGAADLDREGDEDGVAVAETAERGEGLRVGNGDVVDGGEGLSRDQGK